MCGMCVCEMYVRVVCMYTQGGACVWCVCICDVWCACVMYICVCGDVCVYGVVRSLGMCPRCMECVG